MALRHRHADKVGYELDVAVVPLTGNASRDYLQSLWWAGRKWRLNKAAVARADHYAPKGRVRFYRAANATATREAGGAMAGGVAPGLTRREWAAHSSAGQLHLSLGDPAATLCAAARLANLPRTPHART